MKISSYENRQDRTDVITLEVTAQDKAFSLSPGELVKEIRIRLAQEVVSRIMTKLGPLLDGVLHEAKEADSTGPSSS